MISGYEFVEKNSTFYKDHPVIQCGIKPIDDMKILRAGCIALVAVDVQTERYYAGDDTEFFALNIAASLIKKYKKVCYLSSESGFKKFVTRLKSLKSVKEDTNGEYISDSSVVSISDLSDLYFFESVGKRMQLRRLFESVADIKPDLIIIHSADLIGTDSIQWMKDVFKGSAVLVVKGHNVLMREKVNIEDLFESWADYNEYIDYVVIIDRFSVTYGYGKGRSDTYAVRLLKGDVSSIKYLYGDDCKHELVY